MPDLLQELESTDLLAELENKQSATKRSTLDKVSSVPLEFMSSVNRGTAKLADFLTTDQINAVLQLAGSEKRVPSIEESLAPATQGGFMEEGTARDYVQAAGEVVPAAVSVGGAMRGVASTLPEVTGATRKAPAIMKQMGQSTAAQDVGYGVLSALGSEVGDDIGGDTGAMIGAFAAPLAYAGIKEPVRALLSKGREGISALLRSTQELSDDGATKLLAQAMVREGLSPDDVAMRLQQMGPDAIPADSANAFNRLLKAAANEIPRIEGQANQFLNQRQAGPAGRLFSAFDDATGTAGLSVDDEISRLRLATQPQIDDLYTATKNQSINLTGRLRNLLNGSNSVGRAAKKARLRLADKRAAGDTITHIDLIDATKQELDDQIGTALRQGQNNKARDLVRLKNVMISEADEAIPEYRQARNLFAGRAQLENSAELGQQFFRLTPRDMNEFTRTLSTSERELFKLGAKRAILDKIDTLTPGTDSVRRLFGKNGDVAKLQILFDSPDDFARFSNVLEREANFVMTRRAIQGNSSTAKQLTDLADAQEALSGARDILTSPSKSAAIFGKIVQALTGKKDSAVYKQAMEQAGDILLENGMRPERLQAMLRRGASREIEAELRKALITPLSQRSGTEMTRAVPGIIGEQLNSQEP